MLKKKTKIGSKIKSIKSMGSNESDAKKSIQKNLCQKTVDSKKAVGSGSIALQIVPSFILTELHFIL